MLGREAITISPFSPSVMNSCWKSNVPNEMKKFSKYVILSLVDSGTFCGEGGRGLVKPLSDKIISSQRRERGSNSLNYFFSFFISSFSALLISIFPTCNASWKEVDPIYLTKNPPQLYFKEKIRNSISFSRGNLFLFLIWICLL